MNGDRSNDIARCSGCGTITNELEGGRCLSCPPVEVES